ncbi:hypothetical protein [Furfurilactobacillus entadae]|uniref:hypothetical protein n=1 Tax=Furfurilactobacillus entadae TaxID=2922307 RepID=UPI0035EA641D
MKTFFQKKSTITDELFLRFDLGQYKDDETIKTLMNEVDEQEQAAGEPGLLKTLPDLTFKQANLLCQRIFEDLVLKSATDPEFASLQIVDQTPRMNGKGKLVTKAPSTEAELRLAPFSLGLDYQNLTKSLFEGLFNNPEYADATYEEKLDYCQHIARVFEASTGLDDAYIAQLPTAKEAAAGVVRLNVPALTTTDLDKSTETPMAPTVPTSPVVIDPEGAELALPPESQTPSMAEGTPVEAAMPDESPVYPSSSESASAVSATASVEEQTLTVPPSVENQLIAGVVSDAAFPRFKVDPAAHLAPEADGYVAAEMNQVRVQLNELLAKREQQFNERNRVAVARAANQQADIVAQNVASFQADHDQRPNIKATVMAKVNPQLATALADQTTQLATARDQDLAAEKARHEARNEEIRITFDQKLSEAQTKLTDHFRTVANDDVNQQWADQTTALNDQTATEQRNQVRSGQVSLREYAQQLQDAAVQAGQDFYEQCMMIVTGSQAQFAKQHHAAVMAQSALTKEQNAANDYHQEHTARTQAEQEANALRQQVSMLSTETGQLKGQLLDQRQEATTSATKSEVNIADALAIAKEFGYSKPEPVVADKDKETAKRHKPWLAFAAMVLVTAGLGTGWWTSYAQQAKANDDLQANVNQLSGSVTKLHQQRQADLEALVEAQQRSKQQTTKSTTVKDQTFEALDRDVANGSTAVYQDKFNGADLKTEARTLAVGKLYLDQGDLASAKMVANSNQGHNTKLLTQIVNYAGSK